MKIRLVQNYEIYRDEFLRPRGWCADAIDREGNRWVKWQSGYRTRRTVEEACLDFESAPIKRVSDEGRHRSRGVEKVAEYMPMKIKLVQKVETIRIGDRIKFRSPTFSGPTGAVWRKVNGFSNGKPTVRFNTWPDFVVRKSEIIEIDSLADGEVQ